MPLFENQLGCIRDYAEREAYWVIPTAMSPKSFVRGAFSTPEQSTSYSDARVSTSAETIDLVTQISFKAPLQMQLAMRQNKEKTTVWRVLITYTKYFHLFQKLFQDFIFSFLFDLNFKLF